LGTLGTTFGQLSNPTPKINQLLQPASSAPGGSAFTLTVTGTGFSPAAVVNWNGTARATTFINSQQLTASITGTDVAAAGTAAVTVSNPAPGGGRSNVVYFPVTSPTSSVSLRRSHWLIGNRPESVITGDFNGDGKLDLAASNSGDNTLSVLLGNGDGTFQPPVTCAAGSPPIGVKGGE